MKNKKICTACGVIDIPKKEKYGSLAFEILLWALSIVLLLILGSILFLFFLGFVAGENFLAAGFVVLIVILIFPVMPLSYSIKRYKRKTEKCPKCGSGNIIPLDSPVAKNMILSGNFTHDK